MDELDADCEQRQPPMTLLQKLPAVFTFRGERQEEKIGDKGEERGKKEDWNEGREYRVAGCVRRASE